MGFLEQGMVHVCYNGSYIKISATSHPVGLKLDFIRRFIMMRISSLFTVLLLTLSAQAWAQTPPSDKPPKLEKLEEVSEDAVNVKSNQSQQGTQIQDSRDNNGNLINTTVTSGPSTYTVSPAHPAGPVPVGEGPGPALRGPQWKVFEFGGPKKKTTPEDDSATDAPAPPPPAAPAAK